MYRVVSLLSLAILLTLWATVSSAADDKNVHEGTFVSAKGDTEFTMMDSNKKLHNYTLAADAKVTDEDGKDCKLSDYKKGQKLRVTSKEDDAKTAVKVEALK